MPPPPVGRHLVPRGVPAEPGEVAEHLRRARGPTARPAAAALGLLEAAAEPTEDSRSLDAFGASPLARRAATGEPSPPPTTTFPPSRNSDGRIRFRLGFRLRLRRRRRRPKLRLEPHGTPPTYPPEPASRRRRRVPRARRRRRRRTRALRMFSDEPLGPRQPTPGDVRVRRFIRRRRARARALARAWLGRLRAPRRARVNSSDNSSSSSTTAAARLADSVLAVIASTLRLIPGESVPPAKAGGDARAVPRGEPVPRRGRRRFRVGVWCRRLPARQLCLWDSNILSDLIRVGGRRSREEARRGGQRGVHRGGRRVHPGLHRRLAPVLVHPWRVRELAQVQGLRREDSSSFRMRPNVPGCARRRRRSRRLLLLLLLLATELVAREGSRDVSRSVQIDRRGHHVLTPRERRPVRLADETRAPLQPTKRHRRGLHLLELLDDPAHPRRDGDDGVVPPAHVANSLAHGIRESCANTRRFRLPPRDDRAPTPPAAPPPDVPSSSAATSAAIASRASTDPASPPPNDAAARPPPPPTPPPPVLSVCPERIAPSTSPPRILSTSAGSHVALADSLARPGDDGCRR